MLEIIEVPSSATETGPEKEPARRKDATPLAEVSVIFTSPDETLAALRVAGGLARLLNSPVRLVDFRVVPIGAPLDAPTGRSPIETDAFLDRVQAEGIDVRMNVYVCRDARRAMPMVFKDQSMIVIGGRHHRWPTRTCRWRRMLERRGHFVIFVDGSNGTGG